MAGTYLGFPFNEELFNYRWRNEPDTELTRLVETGALVYDGEIAAQIANGSDVYTVPFYKTIGGEPANYDGNTDVPLVETEGSSLSGVVWGRTQGWKERDFVRDFNSGADPMGQIVSQVNRFWSKYRQKTLLSILKACFSATSAKYPGWADHTFNIASGTPGSFGEENKVSDTTFGDATVKACGDAANGAFTLAFVHSAVANRLANIQLLNYRKYTDASGIERQLPIGDINGVTVVVDDGAPYDQATGEYTSYILGLGAIRYAPAPVDVPSEVSRDPVVNGGQNMLITRIRETMLPNGFCYNKQSGDGPSPTDEQLARSSVWTVAYDPKAIAMARVISNG